MKKSKFSIFTLFMVLCIVAVNAAPINTDRAIRVAQNFYSHQTNESIQNIHFTFQLSASRNTDVSLYVININNGFVIVSGDDRVMPVLGYSDQGNFDVHNCPEQMMELLHSYRDAVEAITAHVDKADASLAERWNNIENNLWHHELRGTTAVEPLLSNNNWQQNNGYNYYCPADANGPAGKAYVGCVALAMGQVMHYWQHPTKGTGSHTYECNHSSSQAGNYPDYGTLSANFGNTTYNFSLMPNYLDGSTPSNQILAIAKLLYHCGVAVDMYYGPQGSMAFHSDIAEAMEQYFKYDSCETHWQSSYNGDWDALLKSDLDAGRPIIYCAYASEGGHEFVCDGYNDQNYFHFNMGWGGLYNGYYLTSNLNAQYNFNSSHGTVSHIQPKSDVGVAEHLLNAPVIYPNPATNQICVEADNMQRVTLLDLTGRTLIEMPAYGETLTLPVPNVAPGTYILRIHYRDNRRSEAKIMIQ